LGRTIGCNGGVTSLPGAVDESLGIVVVVVESWFVARGRLFGESHDFEGNVSLSSTVDRMTSRADSNKIINWNEKNGTTQPKKKIYKKGCCSLPFSTQLHSLYSHSI
jgi:hypothetical protein